MQPVSLALIDQALFQDSPMPVMQEDTPEFVGTNYAEQFDPSGSHARLVVLYVQINCCPQWFTKAIAEELSHASGDKVPWKLIHGELCQREGGSKKSLCWMTKATTIFERLKELRCMEGVDLAVINSVAERWAMILENLPRGNSNTTDANGDCLITPAQLLFILVNTMEHWQTLGRIPPRICYLLNSLQSDPDTISCNIPSSLLKNASAPTDVDVENASEATLHNNSFAPLFSICSTVLKYFSVANLKIESTVETETSSTRGNVDVIDLCGEEDDDMSVPSVDEKDDGKMVKKVRMGRVEQWQAKGRAATFLMFFEPILTDFFKPSSKLSHVKSSETLHQFQE